VVVRELPILHVENLDNIVNYLLDLNVQTKQRKSVTETTAPSLFGNKPISPKYAQAAITGELSELGTTKEGKRNDRLNVAAFNLGQLVGASILSYDLVERELLAVALHIGLPEAEATSTIQSGLRDSVASPRNIVQRSPSQTIKVSENGNRSHIDISHTEANAIQRSESPLPFHADDDQVATFILTLWEKQVAYFYRQWHVYQNGRWQAREVQEIKKKLRKILQPYRSQLRGGISQSRINAITAMLENECHVPDRVINEKQREMTKYINLQNGLFNLETFQLEPHSPDFYDTIQLDFAFDADVDCLNFKRYLRTSLVTAEGETDTEMIQLLQEAIAYSLTLRTELKVWFWLVGAPDSGKTTLLAILRSIAGAFHTTLDLNQLGSSNFMLSTLTGKRVASCNEVNSNIMLPDALIKALVGGEDEIYADVKNKPAILFVPRAKLWWGMNNAPRFNDRSGATLNRLLPILFKYTIPPD
jgi:phage/plasmid-associated DNA primase